MSDETTTASEHVANEPAPATPPEVSASPGDSPAGATPTPSSAPEASAAVSAPEGETAPPWAEKGDVWTIGDKPWYHTIQEESVRKTMEAKQYRSPADLAMAYHNLTKLHGNNPNVIALPDVDATPEQLEEYYKQSGRPESAEDYKFTFPEGLKPDEATIQIAKELAFESGLDPKRANASANAWLGRLDKLGDEVLAGQRAENAKGVAELKAEVGTLWDERMAGARRVMQQAGISDEEINAAAADTSSKYVLSILAKIGAVSSEGPGGGAGPGSTAGAAVAPGAMTPEQATTAIEELRADPLFMKAYEGKHEPGHDQAAKKMLDLVTAQYAKPKG